MYVKPPTRSILLALLLLCASALFAQERLNNLQQELNALAQTSPGLNQKVTTAIPNLSLYDFLKGLAITYNLNVDVDSTLRQKVSSYYYDVTLKNLLYYLAQQYDLDFKFTGSIMTISKYHDPQSLLPPQPKALGIRFDTAGRTLTMDLQDDSLVGVAKRVAQLSNRNIVVMPALASKKVNGYYQDLPLGGALEKLAIANGIKITQTSDSVYVLDALKDNEQIVLRQNPSATPGFLVRETNGAANGGGSSIMVRDNQGKKMVSLNITNVPIRDAIRSIAEQAGLNYFIYSDLAGTATANVQELEFDKVLTLILKGTNYTYTAEGGVYMIGNRQEEGFRSYKMIQLKYRSVDSLLAILPAELLKGVTIKEFRDYNSFLLSGSEPQIREIDAFVKELDKTVPMVMIEVILLDVQKTRTVETGLKLGVSDSARSGGALFGGGTDFTFSSGDINRFLDRLGINNAFNIGRVTPNFYASLRALESNDNVEIRQTPKLSTLNGHEANLSIGSKRYYAITTQSTVGSLDARTIVTQEFFPVEANLSIRILPFVSGDEHVTLTIHVDISDFVGNTPINMPPPTASSKFNTILRVKNEEMVVLGGIERNEKTDESSGTPVLSRIPVLKWLFSNKKKVNGKTYSVVFIKPTIIY